MNVSTEKPRNMQINKPSDYERFPLVDKLLLNAWIVNNIQPHRIKSFSGPTSYRLKHQFEKAPGGFYVSNGAMKAAMLAAGFTPRDTNEVNWTFTLSRKLNRAA